MSPNPPQTQSPLTHSRAQLRHTWQEADDILAVGAKYGVGPEEILDFNLLEEHEIKPGDILKIPSRHGAKPNQKIRYEALETPVTMHVNKPGGIKKYAFGNINSLDQVSASGHFPHATKLLIHGIAHVPVGDETLAYYMDNHAFGKYKETGKVNWNVGFAWSELTEGDYTAPEPISIPEPDTPTILEEPEELSTMFDEQPEPEPVPPVAEAPPKDGILMPLNHDYTPVKYLYEEDIELHELHDRHPPIKRRSNDPVWIIGTFWHQGEQYYQPGKNVSEVVQSGFLWPIPMDKIAPEDEMFDYSVKRRPMTKQEKWFELLSKTATNYNKLMVYIKQKQEK